MDKKAHLLRVPATLWSAIEAEASSGFGRAPAHARSILEAYFRVKGVVIKQVKASHSKCTSGTGCLLGDANNCPENVF